ncbi:MAG TPA: hypothetical protein VI757_15845 [Bacteroidia bacterium]|nr:hypothetical protein [Bacteroidia bacterium]
MSDPDTIDIDFGKIIPSTIQEQISIASDRGGQNWRANSEKIIYSVPCAIVGFKREEDKDIHVIVEDTSTEETLVIEIISAECLSVQKTSRHLLFKNLEEWFVKNIGRPTSRFTFLQKHINVLVTGVGFFDFCHGQKGMAENCREIHPVLSIQLL